MLATGLRALSIATKPGNPGLSFNEQGVFVSDVPLLTRTPGIGARNCWTVRPINEINEDLTTVYRLSIDLGDKAGALALIAKALNHGDLTLAAVAAAQMRFPATREKRGNRRGASAPRRRTLPERTAQSGLGSRRASTYRYQAEPRLVRAKAQANRCERRTSKERLAATARKYIGSRICEICGRIH
jgi:hypothetical protein